MRLSEGEEEESEVTQIFWAGMGGGEKQKEEKRGRSEYVLLKPLSYVSGRIDFEWWDLQLKSASNFCKPNHCQWIFGLKLLNTYYGKV